MNRLLDTPVFHRTSVRSVNFFNGRLLSAEDLNQEKEANRAAHQELGQALGDGIAYGLEVRKAEESSGTQPQLTINAGLAVNRRGRTLELVEATTLALRRPASILTNSGSGAFVDCVPTQGGVYLVNEGIYLLTLAPAEQDEGRAAVSGLGNGRAECNVRNKIDAVQFHLREVTDVFCGALQARASATQQQPEAARLHIHLLRNTVAYTCFGVNDTRLQNWLTDPFGEGSARYGLLDDLRPEDETDTVARLPDDEVPLAMVYWPPSGIEFVDMWSVRRRITRPAKEVAWPRFVWDRRTAEGEAMFLQFQEQIEDINADPTIDRSTLVATQCFRYLPPLGLLPLVGVGATNGIDYLKFFQNDVYREPVFIEGARMRWLMQQAQAFPAIDLSSQELLWLYRVRKNAQAIDVSQVPMSRSFLIFVTGHLSYQGQAYYNVNHWDYSNYDLLIAG